MVTMMADAAELRAQWGANIRKAREARGYALTDVAKWAGVAYQSVQDWEAGKSSPTATNQARLCALFDLTRDELFPIGDVA